MSDVFRSYLNSIRRDFADKALNIDSVGDDPFDLFERWFDEAVGAEALDPYAMSIATVDEDSKPDVRVVYMRDISDKGIVFYTNYESKKGKDLEQNPFISANFFWVELDRQIRFSGKVKQVSSEQSNEYFAKRPRESQIGAWASAQSQSLESRDKLVEAFEKYDQKFKDKDVPRPSNWGGYLIEADEIEFWQGRPMRLHDRVVFKKNENGGWTKIRLAP